jgi:hypothetical protein
VTDYTRVKAALPAARARLFGISGVHAVGIGTKIVGDEFTHEPAIMVFVEKKRPLVELEAEEVIPAVIDGVKTDVYETEIPKAHGEALQGGVQITPGSVESAWKGDQNPDGTFTIIPGSGLGLQGTLGFFVRVAAATPTVYGVTCYHLFGTPAQPRDTNIKLTVNDLVVTFGTNSSDPLITPGTLIAVEVPVTDLGYSLFGFYVVGQGDDGTTAAKQLRDNLNRVNTDMTCTAAGRSLTVGGSFTIATPVIATAFNPALGDQHSSLTATVSLPTIQLSGKANTFGGVIATFNLGGNEPTHGTCVAAKAGDSASTVAGALADAITKLQVPGVTADATGATVTIHGPVQTIDCQPMSDVRVGHPDNSFCSSWCSRCCDDRIGLLAFLRPELDCALVQLDSQQKYRAQVKDIGFITGRHDIVRTDGSFDPNGTPFWKRGRTTHVTKGTLLGANMSGKMAGVADESDGSSPPKWRLFNNYYTGAFAVKGDTAVFAGPGDSGAAIVTPPVPGVDGSTTVAGLLFAGSGQTGYGIPIGSIIDAISAWQNHASVALETATQMDQDVTAPGPAPAVLARVAHRDLTPMGTESVRLNQAQSEIGATSGGRRYGSLIMRHVDEAQNLVNTNRKMATVWHRSGGPAIADGLLRMLEIPGQRIPAVINGAPLVDCLQQIASALARYGSDALAADIKTHGAALTQLAHLSYPELLKTLQVAE